MFENSAQVQPAHPFCDTQPPVEHRENASQSAFQSNAYYPSLTRSFRAQYPQLSGYHQFYPANDLRFTAQQTDQTLTALALARHLLPEYPEDTSQSSARDPTPESPYRDSQSPFPRLPRSGHGSSDVVHTDIIYRDSLPARTPIVDASSLPPANLWHSKSSEGHPCGYCGKAFDRPSALKIHMAIHTGERAFVCPEAGCHRSFSVRSNMIRHIRNVHQIRSKADQGNIDSTDESEEWRSV